VFIVDVSPPRAAGDVRGEGWREEHNTECDGGHGRRKRRMRKRDQGRPRTDERGLLVGRRRFRQPREAPQCSAHGLTDGR
jgi:hypothetical protein